VKSTPRAGRVAWPWWSRPRGHWLTSWRPGGDGYTSYPGVNSQFAIENCHRNSWFSHWNHWKWWFSIAM
jgi:hypothetical protein